MTAPGTGSPGEGKDRPVILDVNGLLFRYPSHKASSKKWISTLCRDGYGLPRSSPSATQDLGTRLKHGGEERGMRTGQVPAGEAEKGGFQIGPLNLDICPGEVLSICGPNGSGKTTLLGLLGGWLKPHAGSVMLAPLRAETGLASGEVSLLSARERARRIALVRQESPLLFPMTVAQFVLLGRYAYLRGLGFESPTDWEVARSSMRLLSLLELADKRMDRISGGEKQRAILARALAQQPELLLLDEPTANLDINFQLEFLQLVRNLAGPVGNGGLGPGPRPAVVAVLHDLNLASEFSDSVLLLARGKLLRFGTPEEVFSQPLLEKTYGVAMIVDRNPVSGKPRVSVAAKP